MINCGVSLMADRSPYFYHFIDPEDDCFSCYSLSRIPEYLTLDHRFPRLYHILQSLFYYEVGRGRLSRAL